MAKLHQLHEKRPPVEYVVRVAHHWGGLIEIEVEGIGQTADDRRKCASALLEAAALVERG